MKKLLLLLLSATYTATHAWTPSLAPTMKFANELPTFYLTRNGQGLMKEIAEYPLDSVIIMPLSIAATSYLVHNLEDESKPSAATTLGMAAAWCSVDYFSRFMHEFGHYISFRSLFQKCSVDSVYVSPLPYAGGSNQLNDDYFSKLPVTKDGLLKFSVGLIAGPLTGTCAALHWDVYMQANGVRINT